MRKHQKLKHEGKWVTAYEKTLAHEWHMLGGLTPLGGDISAGSSKRDLEWQWSYNKRNLIFCLWFLWDWPTSGMWDPTHPRASVRLGSSCPVFVVSVKCDVTWLRMEAGVPTKPCGGELTSLRSCVPADHCPTPDALFLPKWEETPEHFCWSPCSFRLSTRTRETSLETWLIILMTFPRSLRQKQFNKWP